MLIGERTPKMVELIEYFEKGGHNPTQRVVCAANGLDDGTIIAGARHWDSVMRGVAQKIGWNTQTRQAEQGFIDQWGNYLTRAEALQVVKLSGQPFDEERNGSSKELFSEGLY